MIKIQMEDIDNGKSDIPVLNYCRKLVKQGMDTNEILEVYREEVLAIRVSGIGKGANLAIDQDRIRFCRYSPPLSVREKCHAKAIL